MGVVAVQFEQQEIYLKVIPQPLFSQPFAAAYIAVYDVDSRQVWLNTNITNWNKTNLKLWFQNMPRS